MKKWDKFKKLFRNNVSVTDEKAWNSSLWNLAGYQSLSGETVTEETALTYSAIWNAVTLYAGTISTLPLHLLRMDAGKTLKVEEKPLYRVLHDTFNPYMTAQQGRECMVNHVLLWGNAYAEKVFNGYGELVELWPITPDRVRPKLKDGELLYEITVGGAVVELGRDKILHIPGMGFDGLVGYSIVSIARKSIGLGMALETFGANYFGQGTHPGVIVSHPAALSTQAHSNLKSSLIDTYSGLGKSHRLMLLDEGMKLEKLGVPPDDSQFLESRQFHISEIARWFNLPPHKLKDLSRSSFSNIESEQISFVTDSILPWLVRFEQQYNSQLLAGKERYNERIFTRHNIDGLLRGNAQARAEYYRIMFNLGAVSINEIRDKENMDPVEGGDERYIQMNMIPISRITEYIDTQIASKQMKQAVEPQKIEQDREEKQYKAIPFPSTIQKQIIGGQS
jgi:HK97 family phage portal protein